MKAEDVFGVNAGKVWQTLKTRGSSTIASISKETQLRTDEITGALGWLGREGKIEIVDDKKGTLYKLK